MRGILNLVELDWQVLAEVLLMVRQRYETIDEQKNHIALIGQICALLALSHQIVLLTTVENKKLTLFI